MLQKKSRFINYNELDESGSGIEELEDYENGVEELEYDEEDY